MKPVTLDIAFEDLFVSSITDAERRERWEEWKRLALEQGEEGACVVEYWTDISGCLLTT